VNELPHSGIARQTDSRHAAVITSMIADLQRSIQILGIDIHTEEERARVFDEADPHYPILATTLRARRDNLIVTVASLRERLRDITAAAPAVSEAA